MERKEYALNAKSETLHEDKQSILHQADTVIVANNICIVFLKIQYAKLSDMAAHTLLEHNYYQSPLHSLWSIISYTLRQVQH